ncbi:hypothetical protein [Arthrobacter sp. H5]|uniref:hypothetical protein n=1 Tax=Arthrobacter sp. H5 TaxID=1267973 RepID=UPI00047FE499|nr:hypothetical protein [Arthrobacter sp. H5]
MSLLTRSAPVREESATPGQPRPLNGGRYVTTRNPHTQTEGTYVTIKFAGEVHTRGTYVTVTNPSPVRPEGRYTDRG